jgi:hypothetical protein
MDEGVMEGYLKQQYVDEEGMYGYRRKHIHLNTASGELISTDEASIERHNVCAAYGARALSSLSSTGDYAFNLVWASGSLWLFLADDVESSAKWVAALNDTIKRFNRFTLPTTQPSATVAAHASTADMARATGEIQRENFAVPGSSFRDLMDGLDANTVRHSHEQYSLATGIAVPSCSAPEINKEQLHLEDDAYLVQDTRTSRTEHRSASPISPCGSSPSDIMRGSPEVFTAEDLPFAMRDIMQPWTLDAPKSELLASSSADDPKFSSTTETTMHAETHKRHTPRPNNRHVSNDDIKRALEPTRVASDDAGCGEARHEFIHKPLGTPGTDGLTNATPNTSHSVQSAPELQCYTSNESCATSQYALDLRKCELERRIVRMESEACRSREQQMIVLSEEHKVELTMLREDLKSQRVKFAELLKSEREQRAKSEERELAARERVTQLEVLMNEGKRDMEQIQCAVASERALWEQEQSRLTSELDSLSRRLHEEVSKSNTRVRSFMASEMVSVTQEYELKLEYLKASTTQSVRAMYEKELIAELARITEQKNTEREAALAKAEQRRVRDVEQTRELFLVRERETAEDLLKLQEVHSRRIGELEHAVGNEKLRAHEAVTQVTEELKGRVQVLERLRKELDACRANTEESHVLVQGLQEKLEKALAEVQRAKAHENAMRDSLGRALEERRVERTQLVTLQRQLADMRSDGEKWKRIASESSAHTGALKVRSDMSKLHVCVSVRREANMFNCRNSMQAELDINVEEVAMLEHENQRVKRECELLRNELSKADRIVYGRTALSHMQTRHKAQRKPPQRAQTQLSLSKPQHRLISS